MARCFKCDGAAVRDACRGGGAHGTVPRYVCRQCLQGMGGRYATCMKCSDGKVSCCPHCHRDAGLLRDGMESW